MNNESGQQTFSVEPVVCGEYVPLEVPRGTSEDVLCFQDKTDIIVNDKRNFL